MTWIISQSSQYYKCHLVTLAIARYLVDKVLVNKVRELLSRSKTAHLAGSD